MKHTRWKLFHDVLLVLHDNVAEHKTTCFTDRTKTTLKAGTEELLTSSAFDAEDPEHRSDLPDMPKGEVGELTSPVHSQGDSAENGHDVVAQPFPAVEAAVSTFPHTVDGPDSFRLRQHIFKGYLERNKSIL